MANKQRFCFIIAIQNLTTFEKWLSYYCLSSWLVVITIKKKLAGTWKKKKKGYWPVQINGNKFATDQILKKPVEVVKGRILAGWAQKSPEPCMRSWKEKNKHINIDGRLENGLVHLYRGFQCNVINASTMYTKHKSWIN